VLSLVEQIAFIWPQQRVIMSAAELTQVLQNLGYPKADSLDAESLEWAFADARCQSLLHWMCDNLKSENALTANEADM